MGGPVRGVSARACRGGRVGQTWGASHPDSVHPPQDLLYRHINTNHGEADRLPGLIVAREDADRVARLLAEKVRVSVDISMPNQLTGPIHTAKRSGGASRQRKADEYVVLGAHLGLVELGTAHSTMAANAALVIEALRAIKAFFARKQDELNGRLVLLPEALMAAQGFNHQGGVAAIVECAGAQLPRVEVRSSTTYSSGFSLPRSSATTFAVWIGPVSWFGMEMSTDTLTFSASKRATLSASPRARR